MKISVDAHTAPGPGKTVNEDVVFVDHGSAYTLLADGMGGHQAGAIASNMAATLLNERIRTEIGTDLVLADIEIESRLRLSIAYANLQIWEDANRDASHEGMGSTVVVTLLRNSKLFVAHVGDSRAYLYRNGQLQLITRDHSFVQMQLDQGLITPNEAEASPRKNLLTRSMGAHRRVQPDITVLEVQDQDIVLCCSDGLLENGGQAQLGDWLGEAIVSSSDPARHLVARARSNGSMDDVSVQLIRIARDVAPKKRPAKGLKQFLDAVSWRLFRRHE